MLTITCSKGFHITFANGWTASVQFGVGNYAEHHRDDLELAPEDHTVRGWLTANEVLAFLNDIAWREPCDSSS